MQPFESLLAQFAVLLEIDALPLDENNHAEVVFDEVLVSFRYDEKLDLVYIFSPLATLKDLTLEHVLPILESNAFYEGTAGFTLGLQDSLVILQAALPFNNLDVQVLFKIVERFMQVHDYWLGRLVDDETSSESAVITEKQDSDFTINPASMV